MRPPDRPARSPEAPPASITRPDGQPNPDYDPARREASITRADRELYEALDARPADGPAPVTWPLPGPTPAPPDEAARRAVIQIQGRED